MDSRGPYMVGSRRWHHQEHIMHYDYILIWPGMARGFDPLISHLQGWGTSQIITNTIQHRLGTGITQPGKGMRSDQCRDRLGHLTDYHNKYRLVNRYNPAMWSSDQSLARLGYLTYHKLRIDYQTVLPGVMGGLVAQAICDLWVSFAYNVHTFLVLIHDHLTALLMFSYIFQSNLFQHHKWLFDSQCKDN